MAIGVGAATQAISLPLLLGSALGVAAAICLWWLYFDVVSAATEERFHEATGLERVRMAIDAYNYGHFPIVAGIIIAAIGVEGALAHVGSGQALGASCAARAASGRSRSPRCSRRSRRPSSPRRWPRSAASCSSSAR